MCPLFLFARTPDTPEIYGSWQGDKTLGTVELHADGTGLVTFSHNPELTMEVSITREGDEYYIEQNEPNRFEFYTGFFPEEVARRLVDRVRPWSWSFVLSPDGMILEGIKYSSYQEYDVNTNRVNYVDNEYERPAAWLRLDGRVEEPLFSLEAGEYETPQIVRIGSRTPGSEIYYTLDGSPPVPETAERYFSPIRIENSTLIKAIAVRDNWENSPVAEAEYLFNQFEVRTEIIQPFQIDLTGYEWLGNKIVFYLMITNLDNRDREFQLSASDTMIIDDTGAEYGQPDLSIGRYWDNLSITYNLIPGIPVEASIEIPAAGFRGTNLRVLNIDISKNDSVRFFDLPLE